MSTPHSSIPMFLENKYLGLKWRLRQMRWDTANQLSWRFGGRTLYEDTWKVLAGNHVWSFIVGCNNSGTSLLNDIFRRSGLVSTMPAEGQYHTKAMLRLPLRGHERVWSEVLDEIRADIPNIPGTMPRLVHDWMRYFSRPLQTTLMEKTPANLIRATELEAQLGDCRFIGMVRNGFAVSEGIRRKANKPLDRGARHWNTINKLLVSESSKVRNFRIVKYEELTTEPDRVLGELADYLGLPREPLQEAGQTKFHIGRTVAGAEATTIRNFNELSLTKLSPEDRDVILHEAEEMLRHFNYLGSSPSPNAS